MSHALCSRCAHAFVCTQETATHRHSKVQSKLRFNQSSDLVVPVAAVAAQPEMASCMASMLFSVGRPILHLVNLLSAPLA
mmetsp:Transcript_3836/g.8381  ORF Transcript_3836/g.8381 Transcript_3836/m.8381 type:complete len:80 (+) Transcript_3836:274-513(+)